MIWVSVRPHAATRAGDEFAHHGTTWVKWRVCIRLPPRRAFVHIATDGGRACRQLIIVDKATRLLKWTLNIRDSLRQGILEWVNYNEENNCRVAVVEGVLVVERKDTGRKGRYTHLETGPITVLEVEDGLVAVPCRHQLPRLPINGRTQSYSHLSTETNGAVLNLGF